jgi:ribosomal protein S18 acetylase RimI-like enzyme
MLEKVRIAEYTAINEFTLYELVGKIYRTSVFMSEDFDEKFPAFAAFQTFLSDFGQTPGAFLIVAIDDDQTVGYLSIEPKRAKRLKHTAWLNMGVAEKYRGKGIGKLLLESAIEKIRAEGIIEIIYLMVRADNIPAIKLYRRKGIEIVAMLEKDTKIGDKYFDGILMRRFVNHKLL